MQFGFVILDEPNLVSVFLLLPPKAIFPLTTRKTFEDSSVTTESWLANKSQRRILLLEPFIPDTESRQIPIALIEW